MTDPWIPRVAQVLGSKVDRTEILRHSTKKLRHWELTSRSRSHFLMGMVEEWLFEDVAGIEADAPGFKRVVIRPVLGGGLDEASGDSVYGEIESEWEIDDDRFTLEVTVPVNTSATVYVPTGDPDSVTEGGVPADRAEAVRFVRPDDGYAVGSGEYRFASDPPREEP